ncbi:hypothetical protein SOVF_077000 [Spinacia oleracea]|nr:hypothetical protein SOVF_077000 [Spinacia oleracea]
MKANKANFSGLHNQVEERNDDSSMMEAVMRMKILAT